MANGVIVGDEGDDVSLEEWLMVLLLEMKVMMCYWKNGRMANGVIVGDGGDDELLEEWLMVLLLEMKVMMCYQWNE